MNAYRKKQRQKPADRADLQLPNSMHLHPAGTVLVYVVVLMLIFGILGVVMVSMFSSSIASSITRNDTRRARYMAESGMRYAFSEIRKADYDMDVMIDPLNTTTYTLTDEGSFTINVFSPWFEAFTNQTIGSGGGDLLFNLPVGELPDGYTIPASGIYAINYEYTGNNLADEDGSWALITAFDDKTMTLTLADDFNASAGERVGLAVLSKWPKVINGPINLELSLQAQTVFPMFGGAIGIIKDGTSRGGLHEYFYEQRIDYPVADDRVVLRQLTPAPGSVYDDLSVGTTEASSSWIILSPRNFMVAPTGQSDDTTYGGDFTFAGGIFDSTLIRPGSAPPDTTSHEFATDVIPHGSDTQFFETDTVADTLRIGRGLTAEFGTALYAGTQSIGGTQNYCEQGACLFGLGVRVFFLVNFSQQGEGITFTLLGKGFPPPATPNNSASSAGGDFELSELMGYAGDSRLDAAGTSYLAANPDDRGLDPPKIAVEFDTRTNNTAGDPPPNYCSGADANADTRNDPLSSNKDAVQYVFWGKPGGLIIPCRGNNASYDDNRHDAFGNTPKEEWRFSTAGTISYWRPAIGSDGTIYMTARDATLYALDDEGNEKWSFPLGDNNEYMPGIDTKGTSDPSDDVIYSDIIGNRVVAIDSNGNELWQVSVGADVDSTPIVDSDGTIYFGTDGPTNSLFAVNPGGTVKWQFTTIGVVQNAPALNSDASVVYVVALDPDTGNDNAFLYAVRTTDGAELWRFPVQAENNELTSSPTIDTKGTANPADDVIYVGDDNDFVYALKPAARMADPTGVGGVNIPLGEWRFATFGEIESSAAVDPNDGTVYIGSDDGNVWAIASNGTAKWYFPTGNEVESSPIVDVDGTVYIGSRNGNVYALKPAARLADPTGAGGLNATAGEWAFSTGGPVLSSPVLGQDGFIHIGSNDTNFYTISQFADPRNFKDEDKTQGKLLTSAELDSSVLVTSNTDWLNGSGSRGSWAVRLEVDRAPLPNADGKFDYDLRLWMRQCSDSDDDPCDEILGTFYEDTRIEYDYTAVEDLPMRQSFSLSGVDQDAFERFFFGFTGAAGAQALDVTISRFQLSFIRPGDPVVDCDKLNWPVEAPVPDCLLID